jgi:hypothetical protein
MDQHRNPRESGGTVSVGSHQTGVGSQYAKPKLRISQSYATSYIPGSKKIKSFNTDFVSGGQGKAASIHSVKRSGT